MITKELQNMKPLKGDERLERDSEYMGADDIVPNWAQQLMEEDV